MSEINKDVLLQNCDFLTMAKLLDMAKDMGIKNDAGALVAVCYSYGLIEGKRAERKRRQKKCV